MKLVKQLRQATGARLVDWKAAVEATAGLEEAFQWLREKGASRAAKLETRTAAHGLVAARALNGRGCLVEVNSETDFVARNAEFQRRALQQSLCCGELCNPVRTNRWTCLH